MGIKLTSYILWNLLNDRLVDEKLKIPEFSMNPWRVGKYADFHISKLFTMWKLVSRRIIFLLTTTIIINTYTKNCIL